MLLLKIFSLLWAFPKSPLFFSLHKSIVSLIIKARHFFTYKIISCLKMKSWSGLCGVGHFCPPPFHIVWMFDWLMFSNSSSFLASNYIFNVYNLNYLVKKKNEVKKFKLNMLVLGPEYGTGITRARPGPFWCGHGLWVGHDQWFY